MYNNDKPTTADKEAFEVIALWAAQRGLTLTVHWGNDASVGQLLEIFDHVNVQIPIAPLRWSIAHLNDASFDTLTRMKSLGVGWAMQDAMYFNGDATIRQRGPAARRIPPIETARRLGVVIGAGTDAHRVASYNPFTCLQWILDGKTVEGISMRAVVTRPRPAAARRGDAALPGIANGLRSVRRAVVAVRRCGGAGRQRHLRCRVDCDRVRAHRAVASRARGGCCLRHWRHLGRPPRDRRRGVPGPSLRGCWRRLGSVVDQTENRRTLRRRQRSTVAFCGPGLRLRDPFLAIAWRRRGDERRDESFGDVGHFFNSLVEHLFVGLRRLREPGQFADELQRCGPDLLLRGRRIEIE
jgi:hypothetical protein